jgi:hypothetical protein
LVFCQRAERSRATRETARFISPSSFFIASDWSNTERIHPLLDILFDTTDSDTNHSAFAHVVFDRSVMPYVMALARRAGMGTTVDGS